MQVDVCLNGECLGGQIAILIFFGTMSLLRALMQCIMYLECINIDVGMFGKVLAGIQILDGCASLPLVCLVSPSDTFACD